ncbi:MAG: 4Fe-4S binding protein [Spirochaetes bacterium]|nr:4Fe-4S binding protein [Spirochaetota bacterium]
MTVNPKRCPQNHTCPAVRYCPHGAIEQKGHGLPAINESKCQHCSACVTFCPMGAIEE